MIVVYHNNKGILKIDGIPLNKTNLYTKTSIQEGLVEIAENNPNELVVWAHISNESRIDFDACKQICHHQLIIASFSLTKEYAIAQEYGFVEMVSPFLKINRKVKYPTWLMSGDVGVTSSSIIVKSKELLNYNLNFDEYLCYLAKLSQDKGLLCYSAPGLIKNIDLEKTSKNKKDYAKLFRFINSTYSLKWAFITFINFILHDKKVLFLSFLKGVINKKVSINVQFKDIDVKSIRTVPAFEYDVLIPTLKRAKYLKDVLEDLSKQDFLPKNVIIIEQDEHKETELSYLKSKSWNFNIIHKCINQFGACNARNVGLKMVKSNWVFLADDDIRFGSGFISDIYNHINKYKSEVINLSCLQVNEKQVFNNVRQWTTFGSGTTFLTTNSIKHCKFSMSHEFGYGEDEDFGLQIRNNGNDVIYAPIKLLHLKAPIGGFRKKVVKKWEGDKIQPIPYPTVLLNHINYKTNYQFLGYKTLIFINKILGKQIKGIINFYKSWNKSLYWANKLREEYEV